MFQLDLEIKSFQREAAEVSKFNIDNYDVYHVVAVDRLLNEKVLLQDFIRQER